MTQSLETIIVKTKNSTYHIDTFTKDYGKNVRLCTKRYTKFPNHKGLGTLKRYIFTVQGHVSIRHITNISTDIRLQ